jgi:uncharacterized protein YndB with AHSA1/START domain
MVIVSREVNASLDAVFDALADVRNEVEWNALVTRVELTSPEPIGAGTIFDTVTRGRPFRATIGSYERPGKLVFEVTAAQVDLTSTFTFAATTATGPTTVTAALDFRAKGLFKVVFPLVRPMIVRPIPKRMAAFARYVESAKH